MIFSLDVRRARKGDCLLLHFGSKQDPGLILIDGGPKSVYEPHLRPRIEEVRKARHVPDRKPLQVDLLMVSHVDDDHIQGVLDLTRELLEAERNSRPPLVQVLSFWHNSFDELIGHEPKELTASVSSQFGPASVEGSGELPDDAKEEVEGLYGEGNPDEDENERREVVSSALKVLASIEQGFRLRLDANALRDKGMGFEPNPEFGGDLLFAQEDSAAVQIGRGIKFTVIGPMRAELKALLDKHQAWLKKIKAQGKSPSEALAAYVDKSVANLSSIVVLGEAGGKTMLLTGDARGDKILEGMEMVGLLKKGDKIEVDVLKVPHHGSANNLGPDFFERIIAKHYVFSGDGEHGNPERETFEMLFDARGDEPFTIHLTYPVKDIDAERKKDWEKEQTKEQKRRDMKKTAQEKAKVKVRPNWSPKKHSLGAFLKDRGLALGQEIAVVPAKAPHVIDLLDPLGF
jgi:hypothetical protein